jgi:hypothetical protein
MKTYLDLKSALCGLVLGIFVMLVIGAGTAARETETGRFRIATGANVAVVIDTQTGRVWSKCWASTAEFKTDADFSDSKLIEPKMSESK